MLGKYYYLKGSDVRSRAGEKGRVLSVTDEGLKLAWDEEGRALPREESIRPQDHRFNRSVEILTLDRGWLPLPVVIQVPNTDTTIAEEALALASLLRSLVETKERNPFQGKSTIGPGPRGEVLHKRNKWRCTTTKPYHQRCVGIAPENEGQVIHNKIDPEWKAEYNRQYKRWKARRKEAAR
jgi:hypothetical protein